MNTSDKIFIAGAAGMVGSAIVRNLAAKGFSNLIGSYHSRRLDELDALPIKMVQIDLKNQDAVSRFFQTEKPAYVFLAAARVGGIHANNTYPAQFIHDNLVIQNNIIHSAYENNVERLLFLGSSCIYPKEAPQPMKEEYLLTGPLEATNEPYALAKIAGIKMCESYNRQYGTRYVAVMPTNLYGTNDNFDLENSHVLPALIRKFHEAKVSGQKEVVVWGTGSPRREFLHVDDMADASVYVMSLEDEVVEKHLTNYPSPCFVNVGTGTDLTIKELAMIVKEAVGFDGDLVFDTTKPDGTLRKLLNVDRLSRLGWTAEISIKQGIHATYTWYREQSIASQI
ncbi:GDP-L-fucose synthase family protein [Desulfobacter latus]|uniref:GDP-L-fucose synthase n=1 Tax=Desulfobacter latus TaxID=2292 RepID=A0A850SWB4_9BACT|nr:GDP-L-fucose synthase [Desulfobacter latus]NWH03713.1 GDP-L-fucose synthase [Desulfobacter latus]